LGEQKQSKYSIFIRLVFQLLARRAQKVNDRNYEKSSAQGRAAGLNAVTGTRPLQKTTRRNHATVSGC
jgi:hypothetical protein